jgi:radical SAM superfamily enzyme YgiQ (UPF0313 family)
MQSATVLLVGSDAQESLGLGYLASVLMEEGFEVEIVDLKLGRLALLKLVRLQNPRIVGLSVAYQEELPDFAQLVAFLRRHGVTALICAGGHYPSFKRQETLRAMPGLDCVVLFEGEYTLLELARHVVRQRDWRGVKGLAYRKGDETVTTPLRKLVPNLNLLPFPYHATLSSDCLGVRAVGITASRGYRHPCAFCSVGCFYALPPGRRRRTRSPRNVVDEMERLHDEQEVGIFSFRDDNFTLKQRRDRQWVTEFVAELHRRNLSDAVIWQINCRATDVEPELLQQMQGAGLSLVRLGVHSGNEVGLRTLGKRATVEDSRRACEQLKELGLRFELEFMLLDPSSTFQRVLDNVSFLRKAVGDGSALIPFTRVLPYAGTELEEQLREEGRLLEVDARPDYTFLEARLHSWHAYVSDVLRRWGSGRHNLLTQLKGALCELDVVGRFYPHLRGQGSQREHLRHLTALYNDGLCTILEKSVGLFAANDIDDNAFAEIRSYARGQREWIEERLTRELQLFFEQAEYLQPTPCFDVVT